MTLELSHFSAAVLFSLFASVVFGITQRNTAKRTAPLRYVLLRHVCRWSVRGGMGDVAAAALTSAVSSQPASFQL